MPNRIIKESVKRSSEIDELSWFEEVVYYRLIVTADDYGCMDGRIVLLKNELFPIKETVTKKAIEEAISSLVKVGLLCRYTVSDKPYLFFPTWEKHQRIRNQHRKYPEPPENYKTPAKQFDSNSPQSAAICGELRPESNPIQSESNPNPTTNPTPADEPPNRGVMVAVHLFENIKGQPLTGYECEKLVDMVSTYGEEWTADALKIMADNGKVKLSYAEGILNNWQTNGRDSKPAREADEKERKRQEYIARLQAEEDGNE